MYFEPEIVYHVYTHANGNENLFRSEENYHYFLKQYANYIYPVAATYAYCLMPNHLHLMIGIRNEAELLDFVRKKKNNPDLQGFENLGGLSTVISQQFSNLFNAYTKAYNKRYNRRGSLFIPNFKRRAVKEENYFTKLIAYIHNNPVKHGFVKELLDWPHSSIHAYLHEKPSKLERKYLEQWFGNKESLLFFHQSLKNYNEKDIE